jgi:hypothetical protein
MRKRLKQLVFLSILLESQNKIAMKVTKHDKVISEHLKRQKQKQHG